MKNKTTKKTRSYFKSPLDFMTEEILLIKIWWPTQKRKETLYYVIVQSENVLLYSKYKILINMARESHLILTKQ